MIKVGPHAAFGSKAQPTATLMKLSTIFDIQWG